MVIVDIIGSMNSEQLQEITSNLKQKEEMV